MMETEGKGMVSKLDSEYAEGGKCDAAGSQLISTCALDRTLLVTNPIMLVPAHTIFDSTA